MSKIYFCDWAVVQLQSIGRSVRAARLEISSSTNQSLCGQRLRATCTAAELQPPSLRSKTPLQMRERRGSDTSAYQGELTGRERWTGACKGGRKPLKRERTWPLRLISNLGKHSKRTESTQCGRDTRSWRPGATGWFHFVINERLRQNFLYCTVRNIKIWEIWIIYILGLSLHLLDPLKRPHLCAEKL